LAERHSTLNGRRDSARLPIYFAAFGSVGLMLAALGVMMTGQMINSPVIGTAVANEAPISGSVAR
jgi:hypothetical protein